MAVGVDVSPKDLTFKFEDSCNCRCSGCCIPRVTPDKALVYINTDGRIELWDATKGRDVLHSRARALTHMQTHIHSIIPDPAIYDLIKAEIQEEVNINLSEPIPPPLTIRHISSINGIMERTIRSPKTGAGFTSPISIEAVRTVVQDVSGVRSPPELGIE